MTNDFEKDDFNDDNDDFSFEDPPTDFNWPSFLANVTVGAFILFCLYLVFTLCTCNS